MGTWGPTHSSPRRRTGLSPWFDTEGASYVTDEVSCGKRWLVGPLRTLLCHGVAFWVCTLRSVALQGFPVNAGLSHVT